MEERHLWSSEASPPPTGSTFCCTLSPDFPAHLGENLQDVSVHSFSRLKNRPLLHQSGKSPGKGHRIFLFCCTIKLCSDIFGWQFTVDTAVSFAAIFLFWTLAMYAAESSRSNAMQFTRIQYDPMHSMSSNAVQANILSFI